jgi:Spy/CpxP family protein refolding chaperone
MKHLLLLGLVAVWSGHALAQNLTPEEQKKLQQEVQVLREKLKQQGGGGGLRNTDYAGQVPVAAAPTTGATASPQLTPEQSQKMMEALKTLKESQEAQAKFLQELEAYD